MRLLVLLLALGAADAFVTAKHSVLHAARTAAPTRRMTMQAAESEDPLLLRMARGEKCERVPVWMMRQAGRHMKVYRDLLEKYPTFRERSEIADVSYEISMQPFEAYGVDGTILFSDILTPLPGMNVDFDIKEKQGPVIAEPYRTMERVNTMTKLDPEKSMPFVGEVLQRLRASLGSKSTVLGFIGLPFTIGTYLVEGKTSREYLEIKKLGLEHPEVLHKMLSNLAESLGEYACYMADNGAQVIQVFDSWAASLSARDYDEFCAPYTKQVIAALKAKHPEVPVIIYIKQSGALLERMATCGADIVSVDYTLDLNEAKARMQAVNPEIRVQGNLDPAVLLSSNKDAIKDRTEAILAMGGGHGHVMNLGHGIEAVTPEENAKFFVDTVQAWRP